MAVKIVILIAAAVFLVAATRAATECHVDKPFTERLIQ